MLHKIKFISVLLLFCFITGKFNAQTVADINGNIYKTVIIGNQTWMAENLAVTKYNDGKEIPNLTDNKEWSQSVSGAYCWFDNKTDYKTTYGALYNWYAVKGKLCPTGWHVPSNQEWTVLMDYLGGEKIAGPKLKEAGTTHWFNHNRSSTNESGFTGLPGSFRNENGKFMKAELRFTGYWWSTTGEKATFAWSRLLSLYVDNRDLLDDYKIKDRKCGFSVRCLKD